MRRSLRLSLAVAVPALLLAACGQSDTQQPAAQEGDPALSGALGDEIMVDPDLAGDSQANSALGTSGRRGGALPAQDLSPEAVAAARAAAIEFLGGSSALKQAPAAREVEGGLPKDAALSAAALAAASPGGGGNCADKAEYTMAWADRLPAAFPVYPRAAVQEAAGSDDGVCALRVVNFQTGVPLAAVIDFYFSSARKAGYSAQRVRDGGDDVLGGTKGKASYVVYARKLPSGATEVDLVTSGG